MPSPLWPIVGAGLILVLLSANAVAYRRRTGSVVPRTTATELKGSLSGSQIALFALVAMAFLAALAAPKVAPEAEFTIWVSNPISLVAYVIWLVFVGALLNVVLRIPEMIRKRRSRDSR